MRFIAAIMLFVVAVVGVGLGVAQRTVWAPADRLTAELRLDTAAAVMVIDGSALNAYDGRQTVDIVGGVNAAPVPEPEPSDTPAAGSSPSPSVNADAATESEAIIAAYGRTNDVLAWVGDATYILVTFDASLGKLVAETVTGTEATVPNPYGGDLWFGDYEAESQLGLTVNVPDEVSLLVVSDGTLPAPQQLSITWPLDSSTPFSTVLIVSGVGALVVGMLFLLWALLHMRRQHGPRRKKPKMLKTAKMPKVPRPSRYRPLSGRTVLGRPKGRRAVQRAAIVPTLLLTTALLAACTGTGSAINVSPSPIATEAVETPAVAVTENQLERIISRIGFALEQADGGRDAALAETRLAGPALDLRRASYTVQAKVDDYAIAPVIPAGDVQLILPERLPDEGDTWPRRVFAIVQSPPTLDDAGAEVQAPPLALLLVQDDPRSQYKVHYAVTVTLPEGADRPEVAPAALGAPLLPSTTPLLAVMPQDVAVGYADLLLRGDQSESFALFQAEADLLVEQIGVAAKAARLEALPDTATITFANAVGEADIFSFVTNDGGALVMLYLTESESVTPTETGAAVNAPAAVAALAGRTQSTTGIVATYGIQILFSVPPVGSDAQVVLLGFTQGLLSASELS